jgi:hypothetical protein
VKLQGKHIPKYTNDDGWTDAVEVHGAYSVRVLVERDGDMGAPWKEDDGHGPVSDWRSMESKAPGERVLHQDRSQARFYDFAAAVKIAKRDGWGYKGQYDFSGKKPVLTAEARMLAPAPRVRLRRTSIAWRTGATIAGTGLR